MISWKSIAPVAVAVGLMFSAQGAQAFSIPVPGVQEDVGRTDINLVPADKLLLLSEAKSTGKSTGKVATGGLTEAVRSARQKVREIQCLATAMYFEARGEPARGQFIVGRVILNRVASRYYPGNICDVVYQNAHMKNACQFSFACDGLPNRVRETDAWSQIKRRAAYLMECDDKCTLAAIGRSELWTSTHYHADYVSPNWANKLQRTGQVGRHIFYYTSTM
jgi:spore germination cell wall hydrolase CwlJ-like protein